MGENSFCYYHFSICKEYKECTSHVQSTFISPFNHKVEEWHNKARTSKDEILNSLKTPQFTTSQWNSVTEKYLVILLFLTLSECYFVFKKKKRIIVYYFLCIYYKHKYYKCTFSECAGIREDEVKLQLTRITTKMLLQVSFVWELQWLHKMIPTTWVPLYKIYSVSGEQTVLHFHKEITHTEHD